MGGGEIAGGLVQDKVDWGKRCRQRLAVHDDVVVRRIDPGAQFSDDLAVDSNLSLENHLLAGTPRADASVGHDFLQSFGLYQSR